MKANDFIKKFGLDLAKLDVRAFESGFIKREDIVEHYGFDILDDLKRLVESHAMIEKDFESVEIAEYEYMVSGCYSEPYWIRIKQAIADVESCMEVSSESN